MGGPWTFDDGDAEPGSDGADPLWTGVGVDAAAGPSPAVWGDGPVPIRPMRTGEILDAAFRLLRAEARVLLAITAAFVVPVNLVTAFLSRNLFDGLNLSEVANDPTTAQTVVDNPTGDELVATVASLLTSAVVLPLVAGAVAAVVADAYLGRSTSFGSAMSVLRRRGAALVGGWLLVHLLELAAVAVTGGVMFGLLVAGPSGVGAAVAFVVLVLVVPVPAALWVMARMTVVSPVIVEEGSSPVAAVRRSWRLVRGRTVRVLVVSLLAGLISSVLSGVLSSPAQVLGLALGIDGVGWIVVAFGGIVGQLVTTPFTAIVATLIYFDQRVRTEALDLELLAAELDGSSG